MSQGTPFVRPEATTWSVDDILRKAKDGQLFIPAFQRPFRWDADDVRKLFDSIYRGYPIGDLLLWDTSDTRGARTQFGPVRFKPAKSGYLIIDGQQRVTSLVAVLLGNDSSDPKFRLFFDLEKRIFTHARSRERVPETYLPLPEIADTFRFLVWLQDRKLSGEFVDAANVLVRALRDYRMPVYLVHTRDEQQIREIFERMNTTGKPLKATEIFASLQRGREGADLGMLADDLGSLGFGAFDESWLLKVVAAIVGIELTRNLGEELRKLSADAVRTGVEATNESIRRVIAFLREDADIPHIELLPHRFPLVPLAKLFHLIPQPSQRFRRGLVRWIWCGAWSGEHARSDGPTIRAALRNITDDEQSTMKSLLASTAKPEAPFEMRPHDFRAAVTKVVCNVLAWQEPRDLETGELLDVPALLDEHGAKAFQIIADDMGEEGRGTENRLLHPPIEGSIIEALQRASPEVRESHFIDRLAWAANQLGDVEQLLGRRKEALQNAVQQFLEEHTASNVVYHFKAPKPKAR